jgi:Ni/Fe-hydrogenase subunit HybB-like protein
MSYQNLHDEDEALFRPIYETSTSFYVVVAILTAIFLFGLGCYIHQLFYGLGATGMDEPVSWAFYIVDFVFFIGISHAGTLISAILRLSKAEWRRPITRMAEVITGIVLAIGGLHPIIDLGRPDRILHLFERGRLQSPLLWDLTSVTAYFTASTIYLYIPMIPDIALLRDRGGKLHNLYKILAWGYKGTPKQKHALERAINILMVMVIPIAISVHTIIAWIFGMTLQPGWHSTIFGPYFVVGAIYSGIAALVIVMIVFRKIFHFEDYLKEIHFKYLGTLLLVVALLWTYFTFAEYLTTFYGHEPAEMRVFLYKFTGGYAPFYWLMVFCNFLLPVVILSNKKLKTITGILVASIGVVIGMWLERLIIIIPTLANPRLPYPTGMYIPSVTEIGIAAAATSAFVLGFMGFSKLFPLISIWETKEGRLHSVHEVSMRLREYLPGQSEESQVEASVKAEI